MDKQLKDILREQIQLKGLTLERLRQQTGIAERYLTAFLEGQREKLPAAPYVRGYLIKLASVLDLNGQELWQIFKNDLMVRSSGSADRLPENRFALKTMDRRYLAAGVVVILLLIYAATNINRFLGRPTIKIVSPSVETLVTTANAITLLGTINPADRLFIDGEEVRVLENGEFQKIYSLQPGLNPIEFKVRKFLGRELTITKQVIYQPQSEDLEAEERR